MGVGDCGQRRLKNTWPSHQNPMSSSSLERKGRGPRTFRRSTTNTTTNAEGLWPPFSPSLRRTPNWLHCKVLPDGTQEPIRESNKTQGPCLFSATSISVPMPCLFASSLLCSPFPPLPPLFGPSSPCLHVKIPVAGNGFHACCLRQTPSELPEGTSTSFIGPRVGLVQACSTVMSVVWVRNDP